MMGDCEDNGSLQGLFVSNSEIEEHSDLIQLRLDNGRVLDLSLAQNEFNKEKKTLFATELWPASVILGNYLLLKNEALIKGRSVVEFGSGAGLPSICCLIGEASLVCSTDYPTESILENLKSNLARNLTSVEFMNSRILGHNWGEGVEDILMTNTSSSPGDKFDVVIASECIWRPDSHEILLKSITGVVKDSGCVLVTYSNHIPGLENAYLNFFNLSESHGFYIENIQEFKSKHMWSDKIVDVYLYILRKTR